ncbi:hypothetical protein R1flu_027798 [Riccia fluitans]|uniref:Uncharacterized protein n=1 Tax=Riccia fluitans TaxID=41844 RepID=A0ABD1XJY8_9MARC
MRMLMNEGNLSEKAAGIKDSDEFQEAAKESFAVFNTVYVGDFIPWLDRVDPQGLKKHMYAGAKKCD